LLRCDVERNNISSRKALLEFVSHCPLLEILAVGGNPIVSSKDWNVCGMATMLSVTETPLRFLLALHLLRSLPHWSL
jgi:hypothetical protein